MDPYLNILIYICNKKKAKIRFTSIEDFFNDGISFAEFVSMILKRDIPNIKKRLNTIEDFRYNFNLTIDALSEKDPFFQKFHYHQSSKENESLLLQIFVQFCFKMSITEVFHKSALILKSNNYYNSSDIFCGKFLLELLHVLTNGKVYSRSYVNEKLDFHSLILPNLEKAKVPIVINSDSFNSSKPELFLIQIQIIFQIYSEKIETIIKKDQLIKNINNNDIYFQGYKLDYSNQPYPYNCYVNIINYIFRDQESKINDLFDLYQKEHINKLIYLVSKSLNKDIYSNDMNPRQIVKTLLFMLNEKTEKKRKFDFDNKKDFFNFIKFYFREFYFKKEEVERIIDLCNKIFIDYQFKIDHVFELFRSKEKFYMILIQRLILIQFDVLKRDLFPIRKGFTFDDFHKSFDRFNIPFILDKKSFNEYDNFTTLFQVKIIFDKFQSNYLKFLSEYAQKDVSSSLLLLSMNAVGTKYGLHYDSIDSILNGNTFQFFVECVLEISLSDHIELSKSPEKNKYLIIDYLKSQKKIFNTFLFDFNRSQFRNHSAELLCEKVLSLFFLKSSKESLLKRCNSIIGIKIQVNSINDFKNIEIYFYLLQFLTSSNLKYEVDLKNYDNLVTLFKKAHVPMIINNQCITNPNSIEKYIYYQLQLYFNILDYKASTKTPSLVVIEKILTVTNAFKTSAIYMKESNKLNSLQLKNSIIANCAYYKSKNQNTDLEQMNKFRKDIEEMKKLFSKPFDEESKQLKNIEKQPIPNLNEIPKLASFLNFYQTNIFKPKINIILKNELLSVLNIPVIDYLSQIRTIQDYLKKEIKRFSHQKLFKIFFYNDKKNRWEFNPNEFVSLINENLLDFKNFNTGLILFLSTKIDDLFYFDSNLDRNDLDEDNLFVYGYYKENINKKNYPIYLFLHVPNNKRNDSNICTKIMQIYLFLYSFSNIQIVLIDKNRINDQIETTKIIHRIQNNWDWKLKSELILLINSNKYNKLRKETIIEEDSLQNLLKNDFQYLKVFNLNFMSSKSSLYSYFEDFIYNLKSMSFYDLFVKLQNYSTFELNDFYIKLRMQPLNDLEKNLTDFISSRFQALTKEKSSKLNINYEFAWVPDFDSVFLLKYQMILYKKNKENPQIFNFDKQIDHILFDRADKYCGYIALVYSNKPYLETREISMVKSSFDNFMDDLFENIIKASNFNKIGHLLYRDYASILKKYKSTNWNLLNLMFQKFSKIVELRNQEIVKKIDQDLKESSKYVIKEVEHEEEIEVVVDINKDIKDEINQDF